MTEATPSEPAVEATEASPVETSAEAPPESQPTDAEPEPTEAEPELVFTHRTSRGTLCACDFGAGEDGIGHGGHPDGWKPELQEDGTVGARMAARAQRTASIDELKAQIAALEAEEQAAAAA